MNSSSPQTVLEIAGIKPPQITWKNLLLLIIDAQNEYKFGRLPLPNLDKSLRVLQSVLHSARKNGAPVVHVLHEGKPGGLFDPTSANYQSLQEVLPIEGESVVLKRLPNAFANTELKKTIDRIAKDKILVLAGYMTHNCISSTARGALDLGYTTAVLHDAVGARDLPGPDGTIIPADTVNAANLAGLKERTSWIIDSASLPHQG